MSTNHETQPVATQHHHCQELAPSETPMDIAWNFSYEIENQKLKNLYAKAKQNQWDAQTQLDWSVEIDPSRPIVGEDRFPFLRVPFFQKLSKSTRETFVAHAVPASRAA